MLDRYGSFLSDMSIGSKLNVITVPIQSLGRVADAAVALRLDFDDAYQYIAAELNDLRIVSLDADFDRTPRGRLTPAAALQLFKDEKQRPQQDA
jgi:predicted nucleic acid-binding protein